MAQVGDSDCQTTLLVELYLEVLQAPRLLELRWGPRRDWVLGLRS